MNKHGITFLLILFSATSFCQQPDTLCPETSKIRNVYTRAKEADVIQERLDTCNSAIYILTGQISDLRKQIDEYTSKGTRQDEMITLYEKKIQLLNEQRSQVLKEVEAYQKKIRRIRTWSAIKTILATAASVAGTILIL